MAKRKNRIYRIQVRFTEDEMAQIKTLMEIGGYRTFSRYFRDVLLRKRLPYRTEIDKVTDKEFRDKINALIYEVNKIGVNYNQVVATWQRQASRVRPDGSPWMDTRSVEGRLSELMHLTEDLRDEFAVIHDIAKKYVGTSPNQ